MSGESLRRATAAELRAAFQSGAARGCGNTASRRDNSDSARATRCSKGSGRVGIQMGRNSAVLGWPAV